MFSVPETLSEPWLLASMLPRFWATAVPLVAEPAVRLFCVFAAVVAVVSEVVSPVKGELLGKPST